VSRPTLRCKRTGGLRCSPRPLSVELRYQRTQPTWVTDVVDDESIRSFLLSEVLRFVERARSCPGVRRIALVGSLVRNKHDPKDADVLVTVDDDADLTSLATAGRGLKGRAQSRNKGADVFLADPSGTYIGRICHWRECRPGVRLACDARHCGRRPFLHDDLDVVTLDHGLVEAPPLELWPTVVPRARLPGDVKTQLVQPLAESSAHNDAHRA
jgi:predicted nucleotidyltransferase